MSESISTIVKRLNGRQKKIRTWVDKDSHEVLVKQVREAYGSLGAMIDILGEISERLSRLIVGEVGREQRKQKHRREAKRRGAAKAAQLRERARHETDLDHAELLDSLARAHECKIEFPDMSELWVAIAILTAEKLYRGANEISLSRDAEAVMTLGITGATTAIKWVLKLTPVRMEDLRDLKDAWDLLEAAKEPIDDILATLEAGRLRKIQAKAASSLLNRLEVLRTLATEWCRTATSNEILARAMYGEGFTREEVERDLDRRLHEAKLTW